MRHVTDKLRLRLGSDELGVVVDDDLGHSVDVVAPGEVWKLAGLDNIGRDFGTLDGEERSQPGRARAMWSGGGDKYLNVRLVFQPAQDLPGLFGDRRLRP